MVRIPANIDRRKTPSIKTHSYLKVARWPAWVRYAWYGPSPPANYHVARLTFVLIKKTRIGYRNRPIMKPAVLVRNGIWIQWTRPTSKSSYLVIGDIVRSNDTGAPGWRYDYMCIVPQGFRTGTSGVVQRNSLGAITRSSCWSFRRCPSFSTRPLVSFNESALKCVLYRM